MRYKLFTQMLQGKQSFSSWWSKVKEQADKCTFAGYNGEKAAKDAILFQTSDVKLRKKILAEDMGLDDLVKLGLAHEHTNTKSDQLGNTNDQDASVRRVIQEEVRRMNNEASAAPNQQFKIKCQTCTRKHKSGAECPGLKCKECFDCREPGHFKGAPCCKKPKKKNH